MKERSEGGKWLEIACYGLFLNLCQKPLLRLPSCVTYNGTSIFQEVPCASTNDRALSHFAWNTSSYLNSTSYCHS